MGRCVLVEVINSEETVKDDGVAAAELTHHAGHGLGHVAGNNSYSYSLWLL